MDWKSMLEEKKVLIADGGWGTQFFAKGLEHGEVPELWNLQRAADVAAIAQAYVDAGSDIILTNSFGGSRPKLEHLGYADKVVEINQKAAELSKSATGDRALVFGSVGPTGLFMDPLGTTTAAEMEVIFVEQIEGLVQGGVDGLTIETMTAIEEAECAFQAARRVAPNLPIVVSMTYDHGPGGYATMMGIRPTQAAEVFTQLGADLIGSNCGAGCENMIEIVSLIAQGTTLPVWAKPNAGLPQLVDGKTVYCESPQAMASQLENIVKAGARIVGGCCGSTPEHIRALAAQRDQLS